MLDAVYVDMISVSGGRNDVLKHVGTKRPQHHLHQHQLLDFFSQIKHQSPLKLKPAGLCLLPPPQDPWKLEVTD